MAQQGTQRNKGKFCCSICLDLLRDPVTILCGHNYCMSCIKSYWDVEEQRQIYSCPQCRKTFIRRPDLVRNTMLSDLLEEMKKTGLQAALAGHCYAGPEDVACDFCTGRRLKALKSCLVCLASYCDQHLQPHYDLAHLKKHKLVEPPKKLQENICSRHDEVMKMFCCTDQQCICYLCSVEEHKGHDTVSAAAERTERQRELEGSQQKIQQRIQDREKDVKELQQELDTINGSADKAVEDSEKVFTELNRLLEKRRSDVKQQIRSKQKTEVSRVKELQEKLEQEITELKRKDADLKQLSQTQDHTWFLLNYPSVSAVSLPTDFPRTAIKRQRCFEDVLTDVEAIRKKIQKILNEKSTTTDSHPRADFLQYSRQITLDPNTANQFLFLSEGDRKVTCDIKNKSYPRHPERFTLIFQVLSKDELTGRCYWEVERSGNIGIAVAYRSISRSGASNASVFGCNDKSWELYCGDTYTFRYNNTTDHISGPQSKRIGVYLDHRAGVLSFYGVSETMTLLHSVKTTFTQPLYAGLNFLGGFDGDTAELCELK